MSSINDLATAAIASSSGGGGGAEAAPPSRAAGMSAATTATDAAKTDAEPAAQPGQPGQPDDEPLGKSSGRAARGALVVLEGLDRSGKTTQVKLLEQRFVELGKKVKMMRFPGRPDSPHVSFLGG